MENQIEKEVPNNEEKPLEEPSAHKKDKRTLFLFFVIFSILAVCFLYLFFIKKEISKDLEKKTPVSSEVVPVEKNKEEEPKELIIKENTPLAIENEKCGQLNKGSFSLDNYYLKEKAKSLPLTLFALNNKDYCWFGSAKAENSEMTYSLGISGSVIAPENLKASFYLEEISKGRKKSDLKEKILNSSGYHIVEGYRIEETELVNGDRRAKMAVFYPGKSKPRNFEIFSFNFRNWFELVPVAQALSMMPEAPHQALVFWPASDTTDIFINFSSSDQEKDLNTWKSIGEKVLGDFEIITPNENNYAQQKCEGTGGKWGKHNLLDLSVSKCPSKANKGFGGYSFTNEDLYQYEDGCLCPLNECFDIQGKGGCVEFDSIKEYSLNRQAFEEENTRCQTMGGNFIIAKKYLKPGEKENPDYSKHPFNYPGRFCQCENGKLMSYLKCGNLPEFPPKNKCFLAEELKNNCSLSGGIWLEKVEGIDFEIGEKEIEGYWNETKNCGEDVLVSYNLQGESERHWTNCGEEYAEGYSCYCKKDQCLDWETAKCQPKK